MWNLVGGLKSLVCSESMHVLARLLIVQPDHTYANALSWSQSIERITASIRHTEKSLYSGPYNHSAELRASGKERKERRGFFLSFFSHISIQRPERKRESESSDLMLHRCFLVISSPYQTSPPPPLLMHSDRLQLLSKYLIVWLCVWDMNNGELFF